MPVTGRLPNSFEPASLWSVTAPKISGFRRQRVPHPSAEKTQAVRVAQRFDSFNSNLLVNDVEGATSGAVRKGLREILQNAGFGSKDIDLIMGRLDLTTGGKLDVPKAISSLKDRIADAQAPLDLFELNLSKEEVSRLPGLEDNYRRINTFNKMIASLEELQRAMKDNTRVQRGGNRAKLPSTKLNRNN